MFKLAKYLPTDATLLEIYLSVNPDPFDIRVKDSIVNDILDKFKNWKSTKYMAYHRRHMTYLYDLTDDNQLVYTKISKGVQEHANFLTIPYKYSKLPIHLFPCVQDIDDTSEYTLQECRINNRISLIIRTDSYGQYVYMEYKHSHHVDIDKTELIIADIMRKLI